MVLAVFGLLIGFVMCYAGRLLIKWVLFLVTVVFVFMACWVTFYIFFYKPDIKKGWVWTLFFLFLMMGLILGYFMYLSKKLASAVIAGYSGFFVGELINNILFVSFEGKYLYWFMNVTMSLTFIIVACCNTNKHILWLSSLFGGWLIIKALSVWFGHYPTTWNIYALIQSGAVSREDFNWYFVYVGIWFIFTLTGIIVQCYTMKYLKANPDKLKKLQQ